MPFEREIIETGDGSSTIFIPQLNEHYHSVHGAVTESRHVFIDTWDAQPEDSPFRILEIGFGTGLNALLTAIKARKTEIEIHYTGLEKYPLDQSVIKRLKYPQINDKEADDLYNSIHSCTWNKTHKISKWFSLKKVEVDVEDFLEDETFDIIYFDAFGADKQPSMWSDKIINRCCRLLSVGGLFLTYSSRGALKRQLISNGFTVEHLPGPPGKREITRARRK